MTGASFIDEVMRQTNRIQNLTTDTDYRSIVLGWLNRTLKDIQTRQVGYHWRCLEKTSYFETEESVMSYDFPDDIDGYKIISLHRKDPEFPIGYVDQAIFDEFVPDPEAAGEGYADYYTLWAKSLKLWPIPGSTAYNVYIRYIKNFTALADDDGVTDLDSKWDDVVISGTLAKALLFDQRPQEMALFTQEYEMGLQRMEDDNSMIIDNIPVARSHRGAPLRQWPWQSPAGV